MRRVIQPPCPICGKPAKRKGRPCCSRACGNIYKRKDPNRFGACLMCGAPLRRDGMMYCSIPCASASPERNAKMAARLREVMSGSGNPFWGKHHSDETKRKLRQINQSYVVSEEIRARISQALKGRITSAETRRKISQAKQGKGFPAAANLALKRWHEDATDEERAARKHANSLRQRERWAKLTPEMRRALMAPQLAKLLETKITSIERAVCAALDDLGIQYETQKPIAWYYADIFVPAKNLIIECDGTYWHDYTRFPWRKRHDERRDRYLRGMGYRVVRLPEVDIRKDARQATLSCLV